MLRLTLKSLWNRRFVATLTILSIALSVAMILGSERLRTEARESFANSASGIDLIVAARGSSVQILMASVFGVGSTTTGIEWESFEMIEDHPQVAWAVPISMGDNHRGFPVIGTTASYFEHFRHSAGKSLLFAQGDVFAEPTGAVIGAEVAARFGYGLGATIVNAHGSGSVSFDLHDEAPFQVTGILKPTETAVDRMVFVTLEGFDGLHAKRAPGADDPFKLSRDGDLEAIGEHDNHDDHREGDGHGDHDDHDDHEQGDEPVHKDNDDHEEREELGHADHDQHDAHGREPDMINAIYVGLANRLAVLSVQRLVSEFTGDALTAVLPNVALLELWSITATAESALRLMAWAVAFAGLLGMVVMLSAALETRRREFAILRSVGVTPAKVFYMIILEAALLTLTGIFFGILFGVTAMLVAGPVLLAQFGIQLSVVTLSMSELVLILIIMCAGVLASLVPAVRVYRMTLADGLSVKL